MNKEGPWRQAYPFFTQSPIKHHLRAPTPSFDPFREVSATGSSTPCPSHLQGLQGQMECRAGPPMVLMQALCQRTEGVLQSTTFRRLQETQGRRPCSRVGCC